MLAECTVKKFIKLWHYAKVHRNLNDFWGILKIILLMCFWFARELLELTLFLNYVVFISFSCMYWKMSLVFYSQWPRCKLSLVSLSLQWTCRDRQGACSTEHNRRFVIRTSLEGRVKALEVGAEEKHYCKQQFPDLKK